MLKKIFPSVSDSVALHLLKWSEFFYYFLIILPVILILYQNKGITVGDFFLIQGISRIATFLLEIPSGYLSDVFSRRKVLVLGALFFLAGNIWLYLGYGFWNIAIAEIIIGFAGALFSGTKEAYAYDLLKRMGREKDFLKENGSLSSYCQAAGFVASILGGWLYSYIGDGIIAVECGTALIALIMIAMLPEISEVKRKIAPETSPLKDVMGLVKMSVKHPEIKWFMLFPSVFGTFTLIVLWLFQPIMESVGMAVALFGVFMGLNQFSRLVFTKFANRIFDFFGAARLLKLICILMFIVLWMVLICVNVPLGWWSYMLMTFIVICPALQKMCSLVFSSFVHKRIKSSERGTVVSLNSMYMTALNALGLFVMKPLLDGWGISWSVCVVLCMFVVLLWPLKKVLEIENL